MPGPRGVLIEELTNQLTNVLLSAAITAVSGNGDPILPTGHPWWRHWPSWRLQVRKTSA